MVSNQSIDLNQQLEHKKEEILTKWFESTIRSYPEDTARILLKSKNRFDNPVGSMTMQSLSDSLDYMISIENQLDYRDFANSSTTAAVQLKLEKLLDPIIRIRAVQNFSASQAILFVFELKTIVKSVIGELPDDSLQIIYRNVDLVALAAFNRFMKCREDIFLLKATEAKRRVHRAFERAGLVTELTEEQLLGSSKS